MYAIDLFERDLQRCFLLVNQTSTTNKRAHDQEENRKRLSRKKQFSEDYYQDEEHDTAENLIHYMRQLSIEKVRSFYRL